MEKGYPPQEQAPPYPGPPMNYGGAMPQPQPGPYAQPCYYPVSPPLVYHGNVAIAPPAAVPATTVTHVIVRNALHDVPGLVVCPHCQQSVITKTKRTAGLMTWAICAGLGFFGCFLCCFIPFCIDSCQDVEHHCPSCQGLIYIYKRM
ncbi:hypothetical protein PBY51_008024 [Eleginops maclovinus]|uniref:LITAF domain-containing protein n=1 Tax=Eleginops maclovinus TaxID=56733 RepID=A0AAN7X544_ELEMC|nr:hypothetical protein PBY51_008024 [Eleginops maclovinus]